MRQRSSGPDGTRTGTAQPRALITNDDGIDSRGLRKLASAARGRGFDVVVAAPRSEASGSGAAMTSQSVHGHMVVEPRELPDLPGVPAHAVAAEPALIVTLALRGAFGPPPDVVLSGINIGPNTGRFVLHSGTVGAALTAAVHGIPAMAVSLDVDLDIVQADDAAPYWNTAVRIVDDLLPTLKALPECTVLNVNVPDLPADQVRGVRAAALAEFGAVQVSVAEIGEGFIRLKMEQSGPARHPDSDQALLADGHVTVTAVRPPVAVEPLPMAVARLAG